MQVEARTRAADLDRLVVALLDKGCCELIGMSNVGKTRFLRQLEQPDVRARLQAPGEAEPIVAFADVIADYGSSQAFYARTLSAVVHGLEDSGYTGPVVEAVREAHEAILVAESIVAIRARFESAINGLLRGTGARGEAPRRLVIVFDEFERAFKMLDAATFVQLRQIRDAFGRRDGSRLCLVVGGCRPLDDLRLGEEEDPTREFRELFHRHRLHLRPLVAEDFEPVLDRRLASRGLALDAAERRRVAQLAGGHPELLVCCLDALRAGRWRLGTAPERQLTELLAVNPVAEECARIHDELGREVQLALAVFALHGTIDRDSAVFARLAAKGVLVPAGRAWRIFSPLFEQWCVLRTRGSVPARAAVKAGLCYDPERGIATRDGEELPGLTPQQRRLLGYLWAHRDRVVHRDAISKAIWGDADSGSNFNKLVQSLRQRVEPDPNAPIYVVTMGGGGDYRLYPEGRSVAGDAVGDDPP